MQTFFKILLAYSCLAVMAGHSLLHAATCDNAGVVYFTPGSTGGTNSNIYGQKVTLTASAEVSALKFRAADSGGGVIMALYEDVAGFPGRRITSSAAQAVVTGNWESFSLEPRPVLEPGSYWVAFNGAVSRQNVLDATAGAAYAPNADAPNPPDQFGVPSALHNGYALHLDYCDTSSLAQALDGVGLTYLASTPLSFTAQSTVTFDGTDALAVAVTQTAESSLYTSVDGPGVLSFYWSCNTTADDSRLILYLNGAETSHVSLTTAWTLETRVLGAGRQEIRWRMIAQDAGTQTAWLDQVAWLPATPTVSPTPSPTATATASPSGTATPTATPSASPSPSFTPSPTATPSATFTPVCQQAGPGSWNTDLGAPANTGVAVAVTVVQPSLATQLRVNIGTPAGNGRMALYHNSGGKPGALILQSGSVALAAGWNVLDIPDTYLSPGTYWVAGVSNAAPTLRLQTGGSGKAANLGSMNFPAVFPPAVSYSSDYNLQVLLCETALQSPTATLTFSASSTASPTPSVTPTLTASQTWTPSPTGSTTATATPSHTRTATATDTPTITWTGTPSMTSTGTPSVTSTPTVTGSVTVSATSTVTPSFTHSPVVSPTFSFTVSPPPSLSGLDRLVAAPVPAAKGVSVCFYPPAPLRSIFVKLYNSAGERVGQVRAAAGGLACWSHAGMASGIYLAVVKSIDTNGGESESFIKVVLLK